jgi:hypothetical protein
LFSLVLTAWLVLTPVHAPASNTHGMVTRLALALSGRDHPYTRHDLQRRRADDRPKLGGPSPAFRRIGRASAALALQHRFGR